VALIAALGATTPNPRAFTAIALVGAPIAAVLTGIREFIILNGADAFPLLAIGLAPFTVGAALLMTSRNLLWSSFGRVLLAHFGAEQSADLQSAGLPLHLFIHHRGSALLLAAQTLIPPVWDDKRRMRLLADAHSELQERYHPSREAPEEATFRDASRIGQFLAAGGAQDSRALVEMLSCFDQSAILRHCDAKRMQFTDSGLADEAREAIVKRDTSSLRTIAHRFREQAPQQDSIEADVAARPTLTRNIVDRGRGVDSPREAT